MKFVYIFIISLFILSFKPSAAADVNCTSPDYYYDESKRPFTECYSDCECDGMRNCTDDLLCQGIARYDDNHTNDTRPDPKPDPTPDPKPDPEPNPKPDPDPNPNPDPNPEPHPDPEPDPNPNPEPKPQPDIICHGSEIGISSNIFKKVFIGTDGQKGNLQFDQQSQAHWIAEYDNKTKSWCLKNKQYGGYLSVLAGNCPNSYNEAGCGEVKLAVSCGSNEKFTINDHGQFYSFSSLENANRYIRIAKTSKDNDDDKDKHDHDKHDHDHDHHHHDHHNHDHSGHHGKHLRILQLLQGKSNWANPQSWGKNHDHDHHNHNHDHNHDHDHHHDHDHDHDHNDHDDKGKEEYRLTTNYLTNAPAASDWESMQIIVNNKGNCSDNIEPKPEPEPNPNPNPEPFNGLCEGGVFGFQSAAYWNTYIRGGWDVVNLQFGQYAYERWIAHNSSVDKATGETIWCFENDYQRGRYLAFETLNCLNQFDRRGCGRAFQTGTCSNNAKFKVVSVNGGYSLKPYLAPNRYIRVESDNVKRWKILGGGLVNSQYYSDNKVSLNEVLKITVNKGCRANDELIPGFCDGSVVGFHSIQTTNAFLRGDGSGVNLQYGQYSWEKWIVHALAEKDRNGKPYYCFENDHFRRKYMSVNTAQCRSMPEGSGCGAIRMKDSCSDSEKFSVVKSTDGHFALKSKQYPNRYVRLESGNCRRFTIAGSGRVNTQYYYNENNLPGESESVAVTVNSRGYSCK